jgi:hypothetical protein
MVRNCVIFEIKESRPVESDWQFEMKTGTSLRLFENGNPSVLNLYSSVLIYEIGISMGAREPWTYLATTSTPAQRNILCQEYRTQEQNQRKKGKIKSCKNGQVGNSA